MSTLRQYSLGFSSALGGLFTKANVKALFLLWLPVFLASAFVGLCCVVLPWWLCVAMGAAAGYVVLLWLFPWVGFGAYVFVVLAAPDFKIADLATIVTLSIMVFRLWVYRSTAPAMPRRLYNVALAYGGFIALSFALAIVYFHNGVPNIYRDGRAFCYWIWLPVLWRMTAAHADGVQKLVRVLIGIAFTIVVLALFQWLTGKQVIASGLVASLGSGAGEDVTRVQMPGFMYVSFALIWLTQQILYKRINAWLGGGLALLALAGLYVNFGRGLWIWTFIGLLLPLFFVGGVRAFKLLGAVIVTGVLVIGTLAVVKPSLLEHAADRLLSVKNEGGKRTSYGWRELENHEATLTLRRTPIVGVGMGGEYRPWLHELRIFAEHVRYIHNTYFLVALKLGIPGLLCFLLFYWRAWNGARKGLPTVSERYRPTLLACLSFLPVAMGLSVTQPEIINPYGVLLFTAIIVLCANFFVPDVAVVKPKRQLGVA
jgi:O-antigen ligase